MTKEIKALEKIRKDYGTCDLSQQLAYWILCNPGVFTNTWELSTILDSLVAVYKVSTKVTISRNRNGAKSIRFTGYVKIGGSAIEEED